MLLLQAIYGLGSERLLPEQLDYNMLYRWLVGLGADDPIWQHSSFRKDRERLLNEKVLALFPETLPGMEGVKPLVSSDHFCRRHPAGQGIPQLPQTCGWQHDPGQDGSAPLHLLARLARALARQIRLQKGGRRRAPGETSTGRASATAPSEHPGPDAWRVVARPMPPCSASRVTPSWEPPPPGGGAA